MNQRCTNTSEKRGHMLEHPMHPLCRKVRGGDNQQETASPRARGLLRDLTPRIPSFGIMRKSDLHGDMECVITATQ